MLFQPTNITPSTFAGVGGDIVDLSSEDGLDISWQVNGNSPLVAYTLTFYANDAASTQLYTTGTITLAEPFYGTDGNGNVEPFTCNVGLDYLYHAGIVNGGTYKFKIRQYWDSTNYVDQSTDNLFSGYSTPVVDIDNITLDGPSATLTGTITQAEGVPIDWVRWVISTEAPFDNTVKNWEDSIVIDSGRIHTQVMSYEYDGFQNGMEYFFQFEYALQNGYTGSYYYGMVRAEWLTASPQSMATATLMPGCSDVLVNFPEGTDGAMTSTADVGYVTGDGALNIMNNGGLIMWGLDNVRYGNTVGDIAWCGIPNEDVTISFGPSAASPDLTVTVQMDGTILWTRDGYYGEAGSGSFSTDETDLTGKTVTVVIGSGKVYVVVYSPEYSTVSVEGSYLNGDGNIVIPGADGTLNENGYIKVPSLTENVTPSYVHVYAFDSPFDEVPIYNGALYIPMGGTIKLTGSQICYYVGITYGPMTDDTLTSILGGMVRQPEPGPEWQYLSDFAEYGYENIGTLAGMGFTSLFVPIQIYREDVGSGILVPLYKTVDGGSYNVFPEYGLKYIDYSAERGKTYVYHAVYQVPTQLGWKSGDLVSNPVTPCGWDWIVTTAEADDNGFLHMTNQYRFGLNLSTDAISNNNKPSLFTNFTRFPTRQGVTARYRTGSLTAYIGGVDQTENVYVDTTAQGDAIMELSTSGDLKFLRTRKGERWQIETNGPVQLQVGDEYAEQPYSATIPWVEIGSAKNKPVVSVPSDSAWPL